MRPPRNPPNLFKVVFFTHHLHLYSYAPLVWPWSIPATPATPHGATTSITPKSAATATTIAETTSPSSSIPTKASTSTATKSTASSTTVTSKTTAESSSTTASVTPEASTSSSTVPEATTPASTKSSSSSPSKASTTSPATSFAGVAGILTFGRLTLVALLPPSKVGVSTQFTDPVTRPGVARSSATHASAISALASTTIHASTTSAIAATSSSPSASSIKATATSSTKSTSWASKASARWSFYHGHANFDGAAGAEFLAIEPLHGRLCCAWIFISDGAFSLGGASIAICVEENAEFASFSVRFDCADGTKELGDIIF